MPDESDIIIDGRTGVVSQDHHVILTPVGGEPVPFDDIRGHMEQDRFWPDVWFISDHGNPILIDVWTEA